MTPLKLNSNSSSSQSISSIPNGLTLSLSLPQQPSLSFSPSLYLSNQLSVSTSEVTPYFFLRNQLSLSLSLPQVPNLFIYISVFLSTSATNSLYISVSRYTSATLSLSLPLSLPQYSVVSPTILSTSVHSCLTHHSLFCSTQLSHSPLSLPQYTVVSLTPLPLLLPQD